MSAKANKLIKGSAMRSAQFIAGMAVTFFLTPFVIHSLGDRMYGLWVLVGSAMGFYWLFDLGLMSAVQRFVSQAIGRGEKAAQSKIVSTSFFLFTALGIIAFLISLLIIILAPRFVKSADDLLLFRAVIFVLAASFAIGLPMRVFYGILSSYLRYDINAVISISGLTLRTVLVVTFLNAGHGILALALITLLTETLSYCAAYIASKRIAPFIGISLRHLDRNTVRLLFNYSSLSFISQIAHRIKFNLDSFVIVLFLSLSQVTVYSIAARLIRYFMEFVLYTTGLMTPVFSEYESKNNYEAIREKFIFTTKISGYLSFFIGGALIIIGKPFIQMWVGKDYLPAYPALVILTVPVIISLMQAPSSQILYGTSRHKFCAVTNSIEAVCNLALSLILVRRYGIYGVALGTAIPMLILNVAVLPIYVCGVVGLDIKTYYLKVIAPIAVKALGTIFAFWLIFKTLIQPDIYILVLISGLLLGLFSMVVLFIGFTSGERRYFKNFIFGRLNYGS